MMRDYPLIVDDVQRALSHLTELGNSVVSSAASAVRSAVLNWAKESGCKILDYDEFVHWVRSHHSAGNATVSLDPLFPASPTVGQLRVSRVLHEDQWKLEMDGIESFGNKRHGLSVTLIDDVALSGGTLEFAYAALQGKDISVRQMLVGVSSRFAKEALSQRMIDVQLEQCVAQSHRAVHLRDACAYLPFSGRPTGAQRVVKTSSGAVPIRLPSVTVQIGLWGSVYRDSRVLVAAIRARSEVSARFGAILGRPATVADLPLLGTNIAVPAYPGHQIEANTLLERLC